MLAFVANQLSQRCHNVSIINLNITARGVSQNIDAGIKIYNLDGTVKGIKKACCLRRIVEIAQQEKADVLIGFTMFPNFYACLVGKILRIPSIMSERGDPNRTLNSHVGKLLTAVINRCTGGVFQTGGAQEFYGKHLRKKGIVIANPIFVKGEVPDVA